MTSWISIAFAVALALLFPFIRKVDDLFNVSIYIYVHRLRLPEGFVPIPACRGRLALKRRDTAGRCVGFGVFHTPSELPQTRRVENRVRFDYYYSMTLDRIDRHLLYFRRLMGDMPGRGSGFGREFESYVSRREHCTVWFRFSICKFEESCRPTGMLKKYKNKLLETITQGCHGPPFSCGSLLEETHMRLVSTPSRKDLPSVSCLCCTYV